MNTPSASISVIIPTFNMGWCIESAIQSVLDQQMSDTEIIVVDDGSTDDTLARLSSFGNRITLIRQTNRGLSAARNAGLRLASGTFLAFLDADDRLLPEKLARQCAYLSEHPEIGVVFSDGYLVEADRTILNLISAESPPGLFMEQAPVDLRRKLFRGHPFPPHAAMLRTADALSIGGFDESMRAREDLDFWLRLSARCAIAYLPGPLIEYTVRADSLSRSAETMHANSCLMYHRLLEDRDFLSLPGAERAAHLRAWAIEVGVRHFGPWAGTNIAALTYARLAREAAPVQWKSWLLPILLKYRWMIVLARAGLRWQTILQRRRFAGAISPACRS